MNTAITKIKTPLFIIIALVVTILATGLFSSTGFTADSKAIPRDSSEVNKRDVQKNTLTPDDQVLGSSADVEVTRKIRERLTRDNSLSINAKNVKIITLKGVTTLRGPVDNREESLFIERVAKNVSAGTIDNKLEVVTK